MPHWQGNSNYKPPFLEYLCWLLHQNSFHWILSQRNESFLSERADAPESKNRYFS
jgi:hypothetical protein